MKIPASDNVLIEKIISGDKASFNLLYNKYAKYFLLTCLRYMKKRHDAEDLLQDSFIKIYRDLYQFDPAKGDFKYWGKRVVINTCLEKLRKVNLVDSIENFFEIGETIKVNPVAYDQLNSQQLVQLVHQLPTGYRTVFNMYVVDGYTHKEIAQKMNISESTSKTQLMKARKMLQIRITELNLNVSTSYA